MCSFNWAWTEGTHMRYPISPRSALHLVFQRIIMAREQRGVMINSENCRGFIHNLQEKWENFLIPKPILIPIMLFGGRRDFLLHAFIFFIMPVVFRLKYAQGLIDLQRETSSFALLLALPGNSWEIHHQKKSYLFPLNLKASTWAPKKKKNSNSLISQGCCTTNTISSSSSSLSTYVV